MIRDFIKGRPNFILLTIIQGVAIFGLLCGFAVLFMNIMTGENTIVWLLCLGLPLLVLVLWVWFKAIIPWSFAAIDSEHEKYMRNKKEQKYKGE